MPRHHSSRPYNVRPLSLVFWDKIGVDKQLFVYIRPPWCSKSRAAPQGKSEPTHVTTGSNPYMVKGVCLLLRSKHKGRADVHPLGDNRGFWQGHLCSSTPFAKGHMMRPLSSCWMSINQRELLDHWEIDNILFQLTSSKGELQQEKLLEHYSL